MFMQNRSSARPADSREGARTDTAEQDGPVVDLTVRPDWHQHAMCKGKTHVFFATPGERDGRRRRREALARAYCAVCTVVEPCRDAGRVGREHGLWGTESDEQRAAAGFGARSPHRRSVAAAARKAREQGLGAQRQTNSEVA